MVGGVTEASAVPERLVRALPDIPRWVEVRSMLLSGHCEILGLKEGVSGMRFVARELKEGEDRLVDVAGRPPPRTIREAARFNHGKATVMVGHISDARSPKTSKVEA